MGLRFYKSIQIGPFLRINISKSGLGVSIGPRGFRYTTGPTGKRITTDLPGGLSYVHHIGKKKGGSSKSRSRQTSEVETTPEGELPEPGFFAPGREKSLYRGLMAYLDGQEKEALPHFLDAASEEPGAAILAASILGHQEGGKGEAVELLEGVMQSEAEFPTVLMEKYLADFQLEVEITPHVGTAVPLDGLAAALLLVELYQEKGRITEAIGLLEELEELAPAAALTLSLCDLYAAQEMWEGVIERGKGVTAKDNVTLGIVIFYGRAMQSKGLHEAAVTIFTEALRSKRERLPELLQEARYWRAISYEKVGKSSQAKKEFELLYAENPDLHDVGSRVGVAG